MLRTLLCLVLCLVAGTASAANIASAQDGAWSDGSTWTGGAVPASGDVAQIAHTVTVQDDATYVGSMTVQSGGDFVVPAGKTFTWNGNATSTKCTVESGGTVTLKGTVAVGASGVDNNDANNTMLFDSESGSTFTMTGELLGSGSIKTVPVSALQVDGQDSLVVSFNEAVPFGTTHVRVTGGQFPNAIWELNSHTTQGLYNLDGALEQGRHASSTITDANSALDSIVVVDTSITPDEVSTPGSTIVQEDGSGGSVALGIIEATFNAAATNSTVFFVNNDNALTATDGTTEYILTRGVSPGVAVEYLQMAQVIGGPQKPNTDESDGGGVTAGRGDGDYVRLNGTADLDYAAFKWCAAASAPVVATAGSDGTWDFDDVLIKESHGVYAIRHQSGNSDDDVTFDQVFNYYALGPNDGAFGHTFGFDNNNAASVVNVTNSGAWRTSDDFLYLEKTGTLTITDSWSVHNKSGNFADGGSTASQKWTIHDCQGYGLGETPLQMESGTFLIVNFQRNRWIKPGNAIGRNTIDSHEVSDADCIGSFSLIAAQHGSATITLEDGYVAWAPWRAMVIQDGGNDSLRVHGYTFENNGVYQAPGAQTWTLSNVNFGGAVEANISDGNHIIFEECNWINPVRRGFALTGFNAFSQWAVRTRGNTSGMGVDWRNCGFDGRQTDLDNAGAFDPGGYTWIMAYDADWNKTSSMLNCHVIGAAQFAYFNNIPTNFNIYNCAFENGIGDGSAWMVRFTGEGSTVNISKTSFRHEPTGTNLATQGLFLLNNSTTDQITVFTDCILEDPGGSGDPILTFGDASGATASSCTGLFTDQGTTKAAQIGTTNQTTATMEGTYSWGTISTDKGARFLVTTGFFD